MGLKTGIAQPCSAGRAVISTSATRTFSPAAISVISNPVLRCRYLPCPRGDEGRGRSQSPQRGQIGVIVVQVGQDHHIGRTFFQRSGAGLCPWRCKKNR